MSFPLYSAHESIIVKAAAQALYESEQLPLPPFPNDVATLSLVEVSSSVFATDSLEGYEDLYNGEGFLNALLAGKLPETLLAFGFAGHGITSQAVHYYIATPHIIIMLQRRWGSFLDDPAAVRKGYQTLVEWVAEMVEIAAAADAAGTFPSDRRLVVFESPFSVSRIGWVSREHRTGLSEDIDWQEAQVSALILAQAELRSLNS